MVKGRIGKEKAAAAMRRRLDRAAAKAARKALRHSGYCGAADRRPMGDGTHVCMVCMTEFRPWFESETIYPDEYAYVE
jgi:hypothetical protein